MFISDDDSNHGIKMEERISSTFDETMSYRYNKVVDFKAKLELSDDNALSDTPVLSTLEAGNVSDSNLKTKTNKSQVHVYYIYQTLNLFQMT